MKQIWLVRHGESQTQTGEDDDPVNPALSALGERQAPRLRGVFDGVELHRVLISPLRRAWRTFELSGVTAPVLQFDSRVAESDWGIAGFYDRLAPLQTPPIADPDRLDMLTTPVRTRVASLMNELLDGKEETTVLFGHCGVFSEILAYFAQFNRDDGISPFATTDNTSTSLLEVDEQGRRFIRFWNRTEHVKELLQSNRR